MRKGRPFPVHWFHIHTQVSPLIILRRQMIVLHCIYSISSLALYQIPGIMHQIISVMSGSYLMKRNDKGGQKKKKNKKLLHYDT